MSGLLILQYFYLFFCPQINAAVISAAWSTQGFLLGSSSHLCTSIAFFYLEMNAHYAAAQQYSQYYRKATGSR